MRGKKKRLVYLFLITILIVTILIFVNFDKNYGYPDEVIEVIKNEEVDYLLLKEKNYSKTLEKVILDDVFDYKYFEDYFDIIYKDELYFTKSINSLLSLGYSPEEINVFYDKIPKEIDVIVSNSYDCDIVNYISLDYFKEDNLDRYIKYSSLNNNVYSYYDVVTFVNAYLDMDYYSNDILLSDDEAEKIDVIVNKYYKLNSNYVPSDLVRVDSEFSYRSDLMLREEASVAFSKMASSARTENYKFFAGSTYRSYDYQLGLYNRYVLMDGFENAETYSARAGYSEHQLGLAVDILNGRGNYLSEDDMEYKWLLENSYKYGFILRYPKDKENVTGYMFEDWHFRYLGVDLATKVYESGLTYDEYVARYK